MNDDIFMRLEVNKCFVSLIAMSGYFCFETKQGKPSVNNIYLTRFLFLNKGKL